MDIWNTCSAHWENTDDDRYKGRHTCHLIKNHTSKLHECACNSTTRSATFDTDLAEISTTM